MTDLNRQAMGIEDSTPPPDPPPEESPEPETAPKSRK